MRVRRRRRRILGAVLAVAYLGAVVWLVSPLWRSADAATSEQAPVRELQSNGSVGVVPLGSAEPLPASLPGASPTAASSESAQAEGGEESFSEAESEATASAPEVSETPSSSTPSTESSAQPSGQTIIGGEG